MDPGREAEGAAGQETDQSGSVVSAAPSPRARAARSRFWTAGKIEPY